MSFLAMTLWTSRRNFHSSRINSLPGRNAFEVFSREVLTQVCSLSIYVKNGTAPDPTVGTVLQCIQITVWVQPSISKYFLFLYLETKINHWTNFRQLNDPTSKIASENHQGLQSSFLASLQFLPSQIWTCRKHLGRADTKRQEVYCTLAHSKCPILQSEVTESWKDIWGN